MVSYNKFTPDIFTHNVVQFSETPKDSSGSALLYTPFFYFCMNFGDMKKKARAQGTPLVFTELNN